MADSVSTEAWLDQRRWAALEEALKKSEEEVKEDEEEAKEALKKEVEAKDAAM